MRESLLNTYQHPTMGYPEGTGPEFHVVYADEKVGTLRDILGPRSSYDLWHVDQTFTPNVPSTTFFWVLETPANGGGDTAFTSLVHAYQALSPGFQETLHKLKLFHTSASVGEVARVGQERALKEAVNTTHPLVIEHPVTKKPVLFVNPTIARRIEGFNPTESDTILNFLHDHIRSLDFSCRCKWEPGTVVVWDQVSQTRVNGTQPNIATENRCTFGCTGFRARRETTHGPDDTVRQRTKTCFPNLKHSPEGSLHITLENLAIIGISIEAFMSQYYRFPFY